MIVIGEQTASLFNPPHNENVQTTDGRVWEVKHNGAGNIVLKSGTECHKDFINGMDLYTYCCWVNDQYSPKDL